MADQSMYINKTRVLFVLIGLGSGGSEKVVLDLVSDLDKDKFEVYVCAFEGGEFEEEFSKSCVGVFLINKRSGYDIFAMYQIFKIIKKYKIDVINAHHFSPLFFSFLGSKILSNKKLYYTEHSTPIIRTIHNSKYKIIFKLMKNRIDHIISVSNEINDLFVEKFNIKNGLVILNSVDIHKFNKQEHTLKREHFGFNDEHFIVGNVANFRSVKNHVCLIKAFSSIAGKYPQLRLLLVGSGYSGWTDDTEQEMFELVKSLGLENIVVFAGYQSDIPAILGMMDLFCLPSLSEGLPVSLLEAMAANLPVIGSNVSGIKEVIKNNSNGLLFSVESPEELASLIKRAIDSPELRLTLAESAFNYVRENHDYDQWILKHESLFYN